MVRNLKLFSLAIVAMLAMSAVVASGATAKSDLTAGSETGKLTVSSQVPEHDQEFITTPGKVTCNTSHGEATYLNKTIETLEMSASYSGCKAFGFLSAEVKMNGCKYHVEGTNEPRTAVVRIVCVPGTDEITVITAGCIIHVPAQTINGHIVFTNLAGPPPDVTAHFTFTGIKYKETSGCPNVPLGTNPTTENGVFNGTATIRAFNTEGAQVSLVAD